MVKNIEISPNTVGFLYPDQAGEFSESSDSEDILKSMAEIIDNSGVPRSLIFQALKERFHEIFEL